MFFVADLHFFVWVKMWVNCLTHTRKRNNGQKSAGQEIYVSCPFFLLPLYDLFHEGSHSLSCLVLLLPRSVGVGAKGESGIVVAQHAGYGFHIHAVLQGRGSEGVPLRYNYDKPEKPRISRVFGYLARFFILFQTEKSSREVVIS